MAGYQQATIVGYAGGDPSMRYTPQGTPVCDFSVAVTRRFGQGEDRTEKTTWFKVTCWNKLAEIANEYVRKGGQVMIVGEIDVSPWADKQGQPQATLELRASTMQLLSARDENDGRGRGSAGDNDSIPF